MKIYLFISQLRSCPKNQDINQVVLSPKALEKNWFYTSSWPLVTAGKLWPSSLVCCCITSISASFTLPPPLLPMSLLCVSYNTLVSEFRTNPDNSHWSQVPYLNCICKDHFPNNVTFTGSRNLMWAYILGGVATQPWHMVTKVAIMHRLKSIDSISSRLIYLFPLLNIWSVNSKDWDWALI